MHKAAFKVLVSNVAFTLGVLCFFYLLTADLSRNQGFVLSVAITMYCLFLLNAMISVELSCAGKRSVTKGVLALMCCALSTPAVGRIAEVIFEIYSWGYNLMITILHAITLAVVALPIIGLIRKRKVKRLRT